MHEEGGGGGGAGAGAGVTFMFVGFTRSTRPSVSGLHSAEEWKRSQGENKYKTFF